MSPVRTRIYCYTLPLTQPLRLKNTILTERSGWLLRFTDGKGNDGWGEAAPLPGFSGESLDEALAALKVRAASPAAPPSVRFAAHAAAAMLSRRQTGAVVPASPPVLLCKLVTETGEKAIAAAEEAKTAGWRTVKFKVGRGNPPEEADTINAARSALGPEAVVRLDANRAWGMDGALAFASRLREVGTASARVEFIEEPLQDSTQLPEFARRSGVCYAVDETVQEHALRPGDTRLNDALAGADCWVVKPTLCGPLGGLLSGPHRPKRVVLSAAYESGAGLAAVAAQAWDYPPALANAMGLDTYSALATDVARGRLPLDAPFCSPHDLAEAGRRVDVSRLELVHDA